MGFSFENFERNENFNKLGYQAPKITKTGTTIAGMIYKDGVVLGCDTRSTQGGLIATKNSIKIHYLAENIMAAGAGTTADLDKVTLMMSSKLELHRLLRGTKIVPVCAATRMIKQHLFQYQGHVGCALILGGIDSEGSHLYDISPDGSIKHGPFVAMGSGCLGALAVLEKGYKPNLELEEAKLLVRNAIAGGIYNDLASGNNINLCILNKDGQQYLRPFESPEVKAPMIKNYLFRPNSSAIVSRTVTPIKNENTSVRQLGTDEPMEVL